MWHLAAGDTANIPAGVAVWAGALAIAIAIAVARRCAYIAIVRGEGTISVVAAQCEPLANIADGRGAARVGDGNPPAQPS